MMVEDVFADVPSEGATLDIDKAFERLETKGEKSSSESQSENKGNGKPSQGGDNTPDEKTPFHKHPRWQSTQRELKEMREEVARLKADRGEGSVGKPSLPDWWKRQYGENDESKQRYQAVIEKDGELEWLKQQIKEDLKAETTAETQSVKDGEDYVSTQIQEMTDEGLKFDRNNLLKFMVEFQEQFGAGALLDSDGNYDFRKSLSLMERMQPKEADSSSMVRKQVASLGRGKASSQRQSDVPVLSRNALRRGNWRDADTGQFTSR